MQLKRILIAGLAVLSAHALWWTPASFARDVKYQNGEITVRVTPGEPTQIQFPGAIAGGFKKKMSALSLDKKDGDLVIFATEALTDGGEAIIVRLSDGRSYSLRVQRATDTEPRDDVVRVEDKRESVLSSDKEEEPVYKAKKPDFAPPSQVSGFMREMVLVAEFGKKAIPGYRMTDQYKGETVLDDGTLEAKIDKIFIGPNYWGYVIDATNKLDQQQRLNPASFRLDGTRAVSLKNWELAARPLNVEQQIAGKHTTKVYVVTAARK